jgi:plasmid maintenance system antidote protein VapI
MVPKEKITEEDAIKFGEEITGEEEEEAKKVGGIIEDAIKFGEEITEEEEEEAKKVGGITEEEAKKLAGVHAEYYSELVRRGLSNDAALQLAQQFVRSALAR